MADGYGSREAGFVAHECPNGSVHLTAENVIVEINDTYDGNKPIVLQGNVMEDCMIEHVKGNWSR